MTEMWPAEGFGLSPYVLLGTRSYAPLEALKCLSLKGPSTTFQSGLAANADLALPWLRR